MWCHLVRCFRYPRRLGSIFIMPSIGSNFFGKGRGACGNLREKQFPLFLSTPFLPSLPKRPLSSSLFALLIELIVVRSFFFREREKHSFSRILKFKKSRWKKKTKFIYYTDQVLLRKKTFLWNKTTLVPLQTHPSDYNMPRTHRMCVCATLVFFLPFIDSYTFFFLYLYSER